MRPEVNSRHRFGGTNPKIMAIALFYGACGFSAAPAFAQDKPKGGENLQDIVVIAQKREQKLIDVPISISAFNAQALENKGIDNAEDLAVFVPNLTLVPQASSNTSFAVNMRGVTQSDTVLTGDSPVGIYVDGIVVPKLSGGIFDFIDIERIEVLRGPQGTLYGRNTPAGAVNVITRKPKGEFGLDAMAGYGNFNSREFRLGVDTPTLELGGLGELSARVTGRIYKRDGWVKNLSNGKDLDTRDRWGGRVAVRWKPADAVTVDYAYDRIDIDEAPSYPQLTEDFSGFLGAFANPNRAKEATLSYNLPAAPGTFGINRTNTKVKIDGHALTANWDVSEALSLKSITGFRKLNAEEPTDFDGTPIAWADFNADAELDTFQQEVQATGKLFENQISYVLGAFYYEEEGNVVAPGVFGFGTVKQTPSFEMDNDATAFYAQVEYTPAWLDRLTVGAGARYTDENRSISNARLVLNDAIELMNVDRAKASFSNTSPSFFVNYKVTPELNTYFRYAEGWRSGGFNGRSSTNEQLRTPFEPESLKAYEIGLKGSVLDNRVGFNIAGFISDYTDLQTAVTQPTVTGVGFQTVNTNIGKVQIRGVEIEGSARLTDKATLTAAFAHVKHDTKEYNLCLPTGSPACVVTNIGNQRTPVLSPKYTFSVGLDYTFVETEYGNGRLNVDASWRDSTIGGGATIPTFPLKDDASYIPSYTLVDARLVWEEIPLKNGSMQVALWGKNLLDEDTAQFAVNLASSLGIGVTRFLTPRTYGLEFSYRY